MIKTLLALPKESGEEVVKTQKDKIALAKAELSASSSELELLRKNKTGSTFFEWIPNRGMNRQQARQFRKQRRKR